jgi:adenylate cyclase
MLSPKTQRNISRIIPFGLIWFIFGLVYAFIEKGILGELDYHPSTGIPYEFEVSLLFSLSFAAVGLFIGTFEILYLSNQFISKSFWQKIVYKILIYALINFSFTIIAFPVGTALELGTNLFDPIIWNRLIIFLKSIAYLSVEIYTALTLVVSLLYFELSENIGQGVLRNYFSGKYHKPAKEERIFMFLDMKSSTSIAEKIGHVKYFEMLSEYYSDLS